MWIKEHDCRLASEFPVCSSRSDMKSAGRSVHLVEGWHDLTICSTSPLGRGIGPIRSNQNIRTQSFVRRFPTLPSVYFRDGERFRVTGTSTSFSLLGLNVIFCHSDFGGCDCRSCPNTVNPRTVDYVPFTVLTSRSNLVVYQGIFHIISEWRRSYLELC